MLLNSCGLYVEGQPQSFPCAFFPKVMTKFRQENIAYRVTAK